MRNKAIELKIELVQSLSYGYHPRGGDSKKFYTARRHPEVQTLTLLYIIFDKKVTPFLYLLLTNGTTFTYLHSFIHSFIHSFMHSQYVVDGHVAIILIPSFHGLHQECGLRPAMTSWVNFCWPYVPLASQTPTPLQSIL